MGPEVERMKTDIEKVRDRAMKHNGRIVEMGNGLPDVGDYVPDGEGGLWRVLDLGRIETGRRPGEGNWCRATLERADWEDCPEGDEHPSRAGLDDDEDG